MVPTLNSFWSQEFAAGGPPATRIFSQRVGAILAWTAWKIDLSPSAVTMLGLLTFGIGAGLFATLPPGIPSLLACFLVLQFGYALDCADGQLARGTDKTSPFGAWLDLACDHGRNIIVAFGLATWLIQDQARSDSGLAIISAGTLALGIAVQLHTLTSMRQAPGTAASGARSWARRSLVALIDTPVFLTALCVLRDFPLALATFATLMGLAYLGAGVTQARRRLPGPSES